MLILNTQTPIEMLDKVLEWFAMDDHEMKTDMIILRKRAKGVPAYNDIIETYPELNTCPFLNYYEMILFHLVECGYLRVSDNQVNEYGITYAVTFEGKMFSKAGGFRERERIRKIEIKNLETDVRIRKRNERLTAWGSLIAGAGALLLIFWEAYKWIHK